MSTYSSSSSSSLRSVKPRMSSLPLDLLHNVLSRLSTISLLKLRSVCREWRHIIDDPHFATMQTTSGIKTTRILLIPRPCMVDDRQFAVDDEFIRALIPEIAWKRGLFEARASCHGLLCFEDHGVIYLFNPLTREMVSLTSIDRSRVRLSLKRPQLHSIGIGMDRLTSRYKIVRVSCLVQYPGRRRVESPWAEVLDQGSQSWRGIGSAPSSLILRDPVFAAGSIHWNAEGRDGLIRISSFDIAKEEFVWTPCPELKKERACLVDLHGVLGLVDCPCGKIIDVWVMEVSGQWTKEYNVRLPSPVGSCYRLDVFGCGGRKIALNRSKCLSYVVDDVGRFIAFGRSESSWTFYDPGTDELKYVQEANGPRARAIASITLSLLSPAKLWNRGLEDIRRY